MTRRVVAAAGVVAAVSILYAFATTIVAQRVTANISYAGAAREGAMVVRAMRSGTAQAPSTVRPLLAAGTIAQVRTELRQIAGADTARIGVEDRVLVLGRWNQRAVVQPVKDADEWDIVGAVAIGANAWDGLGFTVLIAGIAALLALAQGVTAVRRVADGDTAGTQIAVAGTVVALFLGAAALIVRVRLQLAAVALPLEASAGGRFAASTLPLPDPRMASLWLGLVALGTVGIMLLGLWVASARRTESEVRESVTAWAFLTPSALHLLVFTAAPLVFTGFVSLHDWDLLASSKPFVGLANYMEMVRDPLFWNALRNTAVYALYVPIAMALALGCALALNQPLRGVRVLRALVFIPTIVSLAAIAIVWQWMFNADFGLLNFLLRAVGLDGIDWLADPRFALGAVMLVSAWVQIGYQMVIYLAGLQSIPETYYEAARLDGASAWERFRYVTLPLLRPVTVYLFVTGIIWSFQVFTLVYVMTEGGPVHSTDVLVYRIYQNAWEFRRMGYASAMSWFLFALLFALTAAQWKVINRRDVHVV